MATKFLEPGGDATFNVATTTTGGFWSSTSGASIATDFVHGSHIKSIKYTAGNNDNVRTNNVVTGASGRFSFYIYFTAFASGSGSTFLRLLDTSGNIVNALLVSSVGVIKLFEASVQIGSNGTTTLSTGTWYRISVAYTISSTSVNEYRVYLDGNQIITVTNATLTRTLTAGITNGLFIGNPSFDSIDFRSSDHYVDDSSALTDPGNIWVTAKRPNANGNTNGFTTQIGSGGSGYGTGHSPQVNERALSTTNGWSKVGTGSAIKEEYLIEAANIGDIDITGATLKEFMGWIYASSLASETATMILDGPLNSVALTSTNTMFTQFSGATVYPGSGEDIGLQTSTTVTTVSLYECGILVAYIPAAGAAVTTINNLSMLGVT